MDILSAKGDFKETDKPLWCGWVPKGLVFLLQAEDNSLKMVRHVGNNVFEKLNQQDYQEALSVFTAEKWGI